MKKFQAIFMKEAIALSRQGSNSNVGGPFGCVIVKDGIIIGKGSNMVTSSNDPTAHAEVVAIRDACKNLNDFQLDGCEIYTSCEPCPMCLGAIYWARPEVVYFANSRDEAAAAGFDDAFIYDEINVPPHDRKIRMEHVPDAEAKQVFRDWIIKPDKIDY
ncbi:MAG: nucleoside deaminase [Bacteroidetes bacterium]|mgnify:CR=1 FL=1|nr:MAG: nucleoside deaminase [Bacteroidota bacterium]REK04725.1 MAG: nucleoside deaminase [Bacteroidota bacterium]REK36199.1 MAG: nucleoside deaminase [Bacteroidota bacterium]REK51430.1 MAG: nucleoside deaminase [Bacteroidota bacterium]